MIWNEHSKDIPDGTHAILSASKYHWLDYTDEKLIESYRNSQAQQKGTELHAIAAGLIKNKIELRGRDTLALYVNDAIKFQMRPEQKLKYSEMCFGTADAIVYNDRKQLLRISDLKTGVSTANIKQLYIYAGLFFLEYHKDPKVTNVELRIYQNGEVLLEIPTPEDLQYVMDRIVRCSEILQKVKAEEYDEQ